jgi:hypothetical protein
MALRQQILQKYVALATPILIEVAKGKRKKESTTYKELMDEMRGPGRGYIGEVLEEVCRSEYSKGHPLLSALVIHKVDQLPGEGFWRIEVLPQWVKNASDAEKKAFWEREREKVLEYWQKHDS